MSWWLMSKKYHHYSRRWSVRKIGRFRLIFLHSVNTITSCSLHVVCSTMRVLKTIFLFFLFFSISYQTKKTINCTNLLDVLPIFQCTVWSRCHDIRKNGWTSLSYFCTKRLTVVPISCSKEVIVQLTIKFVPCSDSVSNLHKTSTEKWFQIKMVLNEIGWVDV